MYIHSFVQLHMTNRRRIDALACILFVNFESQTQLELGDRSKSYDLFLDFLTRTGLAIFGCLNAKATNEAYKMKNKLVKKARNKAHMTLKYPVNGSFNNTDCFSILIKCV